MASPSDSPNPLNFPPHIQDLLTHLHHLSSSQEAEIRPGHKKFVSTDPLGKNKNDINDAKETLPASSHPDFKDNMRDKFIALDREKCEFVYLLMRAKGALRAVEAGTSFGVSTIYLALAAAQNASALSTTTSSTSSGSTPKPLIIATEHEPSKAQKAREYWAQCAPDIPADIIDLREGDILETLKEDVADIDLLLLDIWTPLALPTLKLIQPHLKPGATILTDNTISGAAGYKDLLTYLRRKDSGFVNVTLPFENGLEMSVYTPLG